MKRNIIESMLYGALMTYLPIFTEPFTVLERVTGALMMAVIVFLGMLKLEEIQEKK